jgi:hypothetical protein
LSAWRWLVVAPKMDDAISQADKNDVAKGVSAPSIAETKDIAEQGFIYGLPLVMNCAIMTAYSLDPKSPAYTAPLNQIQNEARVYTPKDQAIPLPNSDTPYSVLFCGSAGGADRPIRARG